MCLFGFQVHGGFKLGENFCKKRWLIPSQANLGDFFCLSVNRAIDAIFSDWQYLQSSRVHKDFLSAVKTK
jgi:hypothetical protein